MNVSKSYHIIYLQNYVLLMFDTKFDYFYKHFNGVGYSTGISNIFFLINVVGSDD